MSVQQHKGVVLMMAGGTGGHVYPALAIATELRERGYTLHWVGGLTGLESTVVPAAGIPLHRLRTRGVRGKNLVHTLLGLFSLVVAQLQALWLMLRLLPGCVVGLGGYASGPGGLAAWLLRRPLVIHEQNAVAGTANRMLAPLAARVLCGFDGAFDDRHAARVVGNPVREAGRIPNR
jgi:UDP-N-acetylglucosamine--N-acetylmuramyl-(pentapeptide) pyrophosphoryl-undecaprenol N-acetylglucosamine transferase